MTYDLCQIFGKWYGRVIPIHPCSRFDFFASAQNIKMTTIATNDIDIKLAETNINDDEADTMNNPTTNPVKHRNLIGHKISYQCAVK